MNPTSGEIIAIFCKIADFLTPLLKFCDLVLVIKLLKVLQLATIF